MWQGVQNGPAINLSCIALGVWPRNCFCDIAPFERTHVLSANSGPFCYRRGRRRMRRRAFTSVRIATRNFDLELAISTSILPTRRIRMANAEFGGAIGAIHTHLDLEELINC